MRDIKAAERLLSLVTSPDNAAAIAGDLGEERGERGAAWFWRQVLGTAFCLCRGALTESPVIMLTLAALGLALLVASGIAGIAMAKYVFVLFNWSSNSFSVGAFFAVLLLLSTGALVWWSGALLVGATLVTASPKHGMVACALLAGTVEALLLAYGLIVLVPRSPPSIWWVVWIICLAGPMSLLLGGAMIRRRRNRRHLNTAE